MTDKLDRERELKKKERVALLIRVDDLREHTFDKP